MPGNGDQSVVVVTITHNSQTAIGDCLRSVERLLGPRAHAVVVDNASTDRSLDVVSATAPWARTVALSQNEGFGRACNRAAGATNAEWLLFVNPDVRLTRLQIPDQAEFPFGVAAGLASPIEGADPQFQVWREAAPFEDFLRETWIRFLPPRLARTWPRRQRPADWASAGLMLVRRDEFLHVGGFDERFFMYYEDRDLGRRFRRAGLSVRCDGDVVGVHPAGRSTDASRSTREAFSLAGWLEYTGIWRGQKEANRAAERSMYVLTTLAQVLARAASWRRGQAKGEDVERTLDVLEHLDAYLPNGPDVVLPHAREALAMVRGPAGPRKRPSYGNS